MKMTLIARGVQAALWILLGIFLVAPAHADIFTVDDLNELVESGERGELSAASYLRGIKDMYKVKEFSPRNGERGLAIMARCLEIHTPERLVRILVETRPKDSSVVKEFYLIQQGCHELLYYDSTTGESE